MPSESENIDALPPAERDRIDLGNEMAGRDVGRIERFNLSQNDETGPDGRRRKDGESLSALEQLLLHEPAYRDLYERVTGRLEETEVAVIRALATVRDRIAETRLALDDMLNRAAELPDGTKVFRTRDGTRAYTEDGELLTPEQMAGIQWRDDAPSWEDFTETRDAHEAAVEAEQNILDYQEQVLDPARERIDSGDVPSREELEEIEERMETEMPDELRAYLGDDAAFAADIRDDAAPAEENAVSSPSALANAVLDIPRL